MVVNVIAAVAASVCAAIEVVKFVREQRHSRR
jgi:hypothetical protein